MDLVSPCTYHLHRYKIKNVCVYFIHIYAHTYICIYLYTHSCVHVHADTYTEMKHHCINFVLGKTTANHSLDVLTNTSDLFSYDAKLLFPLL